MKRLIVIMVTAIALAPHASLARTWYITPDQTGDAPTIQAGIDSAAVTDTVMLADGIYTGDGNRDIEYCGKAITVRSESENPELCIIDREGSETDPHTGFYLHQGEGPG